MSTANGIAHRNSEGRKNCRGWRAEGDNLQENVTHTGETFPRKQAACAVRSSPREQGHAPSIDTAQIRTQERTGIQRVVKTETTESK